MEFHVKFDHPQGRHVTGLDRFNNIGHSRAQDSHHLVARLPQLKCTGQHVNHAPDAVLDSMIREQPGRHCVMCKHRGFLVGADIGRKSAHDW
jgi:hypothetical protein